MKHRSRIIALPVFVLIISLLLSAYAAAEDSIYSLELRPTAAEMGFDLEAMYARLPFFPLIWEEDTLTIIDGGQYKRVYIMLRSWDSLEGECIDDQWSFTVNPEDIDRIHLFPHEGDPIECYANGLMMPPGFEPYVLDGMNLRLEGGQNGYDSARWNFYMPDDSEAQYDMVRFTLDGSMDLYAFTQPQLLEADGETYEVHTEYLPSKVSFQMVEKDGEYLIERIEETGSTLTRLWLTKDGIEEFTYSLENWYPADTPVPGNLHELSHEDLMERFPALPVY